MQKEPALSIGLITAVIQAAIGLAVAFGADVSEDQKQALIVFVSAAFPIIMLMSAAIRQRVVSPATAGEAVAIAKTNSPTSPNVPAVNVPGYETQVAKFLNVAPSMLSFRPEADGDIQPGA